MSGDRYTEVDSDDDEIMDLYYNPPQEEGEVRESGNGSGVHEQHVPTAVENLMEENDSPRKVIDVLRIIGRDKGSIGVTKVRMKKFKDIEEKRDKTLVRGFRNCIFKVPKCLLLLYHNALTEEGMKEILPPTNQEDALE